MPMLPDLTDTDRALYEWQMWVPGVGEEGQRKLKGASVLISRVGGLGGLVALELAAAGVGKLVLAHGGFILQRDKHHAVGSLRTLAGGDQAAGAPARRAEAVRRRRSGPWARASSQVLRRKLHLGADAALLPRGQARFRG